MTSTQTAAAMEWTRDAAILIGRAVASNTRRLLRTCRAIITVSRKHLPKWLGIVLGIAVAIPGPQDELLVLLIIGVFVAFKPVMRAELVTATREAWTK